MNMRTHSFVTHMRPEDACQLIEFIDQLRDLLMQSYGEKIKAMLQKASQQDPTCEVLDMQDALF